MAFDRNMLRLGILLIIAFSQSDARECKLGCIGSSSSLLNYEKGKSYQYDFMGTSATVLPGSKGDASKVSISAKVEIIAGDKCDYAIALSNVHTAGADGKKHELSPSLFAKPTLFGLQNGKIEELCADESESIVSLNIKRAALSLIQSAMLKEGGSGSMAENDIYGNCPTSFSFSKNGNSLTVHKTRNLNRCAFRENWNNDHFVSPYFATSEIQGTALLRGAYSSVRTIENGVVKHANSEENYDYNPLSGPESLTRVHVATKLDLTGTGSKSLPSVKGTGKTLLFEPVHQSESPKTAEDIVRLLKNICDSREVKADSAKEFSDLVEVVSKSSSKVLLDVKGRTKSGAGFKDKSAAQKVFIEAILYGKSGSSVEILADILKNEKNDALTTEILFGRFGYVKHATRAALTSTLPLLTPSAPHSAYLGLGALGGRFCAEHKCAGVPEVEAFQKKLAAPLLTKGCKPNTKEEEDTLIASLKGLANMKHLGSVVVPKLKECVGDKTVKNRVRVAMLETIRTDAHKSDFKETLIKVFKCPKEDSEVRIKAYLALAECPCGKVSAAVKEVLDARKSNQVTSFVVTHLKNLKASTDPSKEHAQHILKNVDYSSYRYARHLYDIRKFSQNRELSYQFDALNVGAVGESNVIYSQTSWVPRSVSLNITTQLFGHSINLFEIDARTEKLEKVLEHIFGPKGQLRSEDPSKLFKKGKDYMNNVLEQIASKYEKSFRPKRSAKDHDFGHEEIDIDFSVKSFGSEIFWDKMHTKDLKLRSKNAINNVFNMVDYSISKAKNLNQDLRFHSIMLDLEVAYPTGLGLPLKLRVEGSSAVRVKLDGKLDIPAIMKDPKNTDLRFQIMPSAAVDLKGDISIDGVAVESGVRVMANIHSSTGSDLTFRVLDGHGVDVKIGLPIAKQDIISLKTDAKTFVKTQDKPEVLTALVFDVKKESYQGCFDQLTPLIGLTFCGEVSTPWEGIRAISPVYGPSTVYIHVDKEDESLTKYHFKVLSFYKEKEEAKFEILLDTPNSVENRKIALLAEAGLGAKKFLKIDFVSPITSANFNGAVTDNKGELSVLAKLDNNGTEYLLKAGFLKTEEGKQMKIFPILEYKSPELKTTLIGRRGQKPQQQSYSASGVIIIDHEEKSHLVKFKVDKLALNTPRGQYVADGTGSYDDKGMEGDVKLSNGKDTIAVKGHVHGLQMGAPQNIWLSVAPSAYPDLGIDLKWDFLFNKEKKEGKSNLIIVHGQDSKSEMSRITLYNYFHNDQKNSKVTAENKLTYPVLNLEGGLDFKFSPKSAVGRVKAKLDKYSSELKVDSEINVKKEGEYKFEVDAELMGNELAVKSARKIVKNAQSKWTNSIELKPGGKYEFNAVTTNKIKDKDVDMQIDADIRLPADPKHLKLTAGRKKTGSDYKTFLKAIAGDKTYIEIDTSYKISDKPTGNFHVKLLNLIDSSGDFAFDGSKFKAKSKADFLKINKKMEGKVDLVTGGEKVNGFVDFCWDTKQPSKSFKVQTDTNWADQSFQTKNTIIYQDAKTQINAHGKMVGDILTTGNGEGAFEVVLSNGYKFGLKQVDSWDASDVKNQIYDAATDFHYQKPGGEPSTVTMKLTGKNVQFSAPLKFDGHVTLGYNGPNKKTATAHLNLKKMPKESGIWIVKGEAGASGSLVPRRILVSLDSEVSNALFEGENMLTDITMTPLNYHLTFAAGDDMKLEASAKLDKFSLNGELSGKLPEKSTLKEFKWKSDSLYDPENTKVKLSNSLHYNGDHFYKSEGEFALLEDGLTFDTAWETNEYPKRTVRGAIHASADNNTIRGDLSGTATWDGKTADLSVKGDHDRNTPAGSLHILSSGPTGKYDVSLKNKVVKNGRGVHTDVIYINPDKKVVVSSKVEMDKDHPLIDINIDHGDSKSKLMIKLDRLGERQMASEVKAKWSNNGGSFAADSNLDLSSLDNFSIKFNVAPPSPNHKYNIDITNHPDKDASNRISINVKRDDSPFVVGSASYSLKEEGDMTTVEGSGSVKYQDKTYPVTYKATGKKLVDGSQSKLDLKVGKYSLNIENLFTPKEFLLERVYCQESGKCFKALAHTKTTSGDSLGEYSQTSSLILDLSVFNPKFHDISISSDFKRHLLVQDHKVSVKYGKSGKMEYNAFVHESQSGVLISLPKRTIGAEFKYSLGDSSKPYKVNVGADLWFNKEANEKLSASFVSDVDLQKDSTVISGESKLTHPGLKKDYIVKGKTVISDKTGKQLEGELVIDLFAQPNQKIMANWKAATSTEGKAYTGHSVWTVKSEACKLNIVVERRLVVNPEEYIINWSESANYVDQSGKKQEGGIKAEISPKKVHASVKVPDFTVLEVDIKMDKKDKQITYGGSYVVLGQKCKDSFAYDISTNHINYLANYDGKSLEFVAGAKMGKAGTAKLTLDKKNAAEFEVALDEANFLKSKYNYDADVLKAIWHSMADAVHSAAKNVDSTFKAKIEKKREELKKITECYSKSMPNFKSMGEKFVAESKEIRDELASDKDLSQMGELFKNAFGSALKQAEPIVEAVEKLFETICELAEKGMKTAVKVYEEMSPQMTETIRHMSTILMQMFEETFEVVVKIADHILDELKKHEADLKEYMETVSELVHEVGKQFSKIAFIVHDELKKLFETLSEQLKELPVIAMIEEKLVELKQWKMPEEAWHMLSEFVKDLYSVAPTDECIELLEALGNYIDKVVKQEKFDKEAAARDVFLKFEAATRSVIKLLTEMIPEKTGLSFDKYLKLPYLTSIWIPTGGLRVSLVNMFKNGDFPNPIKVLADLQLSYKPLDNIPPFRGFGSVIAGDQVITFDGRRIDTISNCVYILAKDMVNGNFTVSAKMNHGAPEYIEVTDKTGSIRLFAGEKKPELNGAAKDFPIVTKDLFSAWTPTHVSIASKAGVKVSCFADLVLCQVRVNGFYFNQVGGLLGNLNHEQWDDTTDAKGEVNSNESEFAATWGEGCAPAPAHEDAAVSGCHALFTDSQEMYLGAFWEDTETWRRACNHAVASLPSNDEKRNLGCKLAQGFTASARARGAFLMTTPTECSSCKVNNKEISDDSEEEVKEDKLADVVIVVEATDDNKEIVEKYVEPVMKDLQNDLQAKGITDVEFKLVTFHPNFPFPMFHTFNGKSASKQPPKFTIEFKETENYRVNGSLYERFKFVTDHLFSEIGDTPLTRSYSDVLQHVDFRPGAYRAVVGVHAEPCHSVAIINPLLAAESLAYGLIGKVRGISFNVITPLKTHETEHSVDMSKVNALGMDGVHMQGETEKVKLSKTDFTLDYCVLTAISNGGYVFPTNNALNNPDSVKTAAALITESMMKNGKGERSCECSLVNGVWPKARCWFLE